jgi:hypothetical protein
MTDRDPLEWLIAIFGMRNVVVADEAIRRLEGKEGATRADFKTDPRLDKMTVVWPLVGRVRRSVRHALLGPDSYGRHARDDPRRRRLVAFAESLRTHR